MVRNAKGEERWEREFPEADAARKLRTYTHIHTLLRSVTPPVHSPFTTVHSLSSYTSLVKVDHTHTHPQAKIWQGGGERERVCSGQIQKKKKKHLPSLR